MTVKIASITLATTNTQQMVAFYNATLATNLSPFEPFPNATFYTGELADIPLTLCPNTIAQVNANQNRQQFRFIVDDVHNTMQAALDNGGTELEAISEQNGMIIGSVYDPDGNSVVFSQITES